MDTLLQSIASQGIIGVLLALSILANVSFYKEIKSLQDKRVEEAKAVRDTLSEPIKLISENIGLIYNKLRAEKEK